MPNPLKRFMQTSGTFRRALVGLASVIGIGLALSVTLTGCAPAASSDPLVAMTVGGTPVTLSAYQQELALITASSALQADASASAVGWTSPIDRGMVTSSRQQTTQFFANLLMVQTQMKAQHLSVSQNDVDVAVKTLNSSVASARAQLAQTPGNMRLRQLINAATPDAIHWLAVQQAYYTVFFNKGKLPTAHMRGILVKSQADANALVKQLNAGADFATLAKANSLDSTGSTGGDLGTVWVGQLGPKFDAQVFAVKNIPHYFAIPVASGYGVFEIVGGVTQTAISTTSDQTTAQNYVDAWLSDVLAKQYVTHVYVGA